MSKEERLFLWTTRSRVWQQQWVGTLTTWKKWRVCSMSMIHAKLVGQSKWKLKSPKISILPPRRLQCSRKSPNSEKNADSVSLFFFDGGGLYRQKKQMSCSGVTVSWASLQDKWLNRKDSNSNSSRWCLPQWKPTVRWHLSLNEETIACCTWVASCLHAWPHLPNVSTRFL